MLDLKDQADVDKALELIKRADVVVENFRPGAMAKLGLGYDVAKAINPKVVYCSISGFGQTGPLSSRAAYAPVAHAFSGFDMMLSRMADSEAPPLFNRVMIADVLAGTNGFAAIQTALLHRLRNGEGSHVDVTMTEGMMSLVGMQMQIAQTTRDYLSPAHPPYKTSDGYVNLPVVSVPTYRAAYELIGRDDWLADPAMSTLAGIAERRQEVFKAIGDWCATRTSEECDRLATAANVPSAIYLMPHEAIEHPHTLARGTFGTINTQNASFKVLNLPFKISGTSLDANPFVSALGADTQAVLGGLLAAKDPVSETT